MPVENIVTIAYFLGMRCLQTCNFLQLLIIFVIQLKLQIVGELILKFKALDNL